MKSTEERERYRKKNEKERKKTFRIYKGAVQQTHTHERGSKKEPRERGASRRCKQPELIAPRGFDGVLRASYAPAQDIGRRNREEESGLLLENGKGRMDKRV